jgi:hypothetical protein
MEIRFAVDDRLVQLAKTLVTGRVRILILSAAFLGLAGGAYATTQGIVLFAAESKIRAAEMNANFAYQKQQIEALTQLDADLKAQLNQRNTALATSLDKVTDSTTAANAAAASASAKAQQFAVDEQAHVDAAAAAIAAATPAPPPTNPGP